MTLTNAGLKYRPAVNLPHVRWFQRQVYHRTQDKLVFKCMQPSDQTVQIFITASSKLDFVLVILVLIYLTELTDNSGALHEQSFPRLHLVTH